MTMLLASRSGRFALALAVFAVLVGCAHRGPEPARPFLYRIAAEPPSYLFGTIHVPDPRVLAFPPSVQRAIDGADVVYNELALGADAQPQLANLAATQAEAPLSERLPEDVYTRLTAYLGRRGLPEGVFDRMPLWMVVATLPLLDYLEELKTRLPQDLEIARRAQATGAELRGLELPEEQVDALESAGSEGLITQLRQTLDLLEDAERRGERPLEEVVLAYLAGDGARVVDASLGQVDMADESNQILLESLMHARSEQMAQRIGAVLRDEPGRRYLFAVGVGHLPGERGVLARLREDGLFVERLPRD